MLRITDLIFGLDIGDCITGLDRPLESQEVEDPRISRQPAHKSGEFVSLT
jgi:hypothetical protein